MNDGQSDQRSMIEAWNRVDELARGLRERGSRIVFTNGCFDLLHVGHLRLLQTARSFGDALIVGLNSDESVSKLKGSGRPLVPQAERSELLAALSCVDHVIVFEQSTPIELLRIVRPHIHVKGDEYAPGLGKKMPEAEVLKELGVEIRLVPMVAGRSTTNLIKQVAASAGKQPSVRP